VAALGEAGGVPLVDGYRTGRLLGFGSSGEVWSARAVDSGELVALKVLSPERADPSRVLRETSVLRRLDHPHVVRLRAVTQTAQGEAVLVLDRALGGSIGALVGARGALDVGEAVTVLAPLAGALADLHERGLVHGDVAPGNVLFQESGVPQLADLGLASIIGEPPPGDVHGTAGYTDPARLAGAPPSPASDVYALAAVGWLALTGRAPQPPGERPPLVTVAPHVPRDLALALEEALAVDPQARPTARELAVRCFDAAPAAPVRLVPTDPGAAPAEVVTHRLRAAVAAASSADAPGAVRGRHRRVDTAAWVTWRRGSLVGLLVVAVAAAVLLYVLSPDAPPAEAAPQSAAPAATATVGPVTPTAATVPDPVDRALRSDDPVAAVPALAWLRAQAFASGDRALLERAATREGPALVDDLDRLEQLVDAGVVLAGLAFDVRRVEVLSRDADRAVVEATVVALPHRQQRADGTVVAQMAAAPERTSRLVLQRGDAGWQVDSVG
jgi:hypothetical protein